MDDIRSSPHSIELPPAAADRYAVESVLGQGGMGVVLLARDLSLDRKVALKLVHPEYASERAFRKRLRREAMALARMCSPHVVKLIELIEDRGEVRIGIGPVMTPTTAAGLGHTNGATEARGDVPQPDARSRHAP